MSQNKLREEFKKYIYSTFSGTSGAASSYDNAIGQLLDYLEIDSIDKAIKSHRKILSFKDAPKNVEDFLRIYPNYPERKSYIESGYIAAGLTHFKTFIDIELKKQLNHYIDEPLKIELAKYDESILENIINFTDDAGIKIINKDVRERILNVSIIKDLKSLYDHKCQLCGREFFQPYGVKISEGHHIDPFSKSFNNNPDNIVILCPNHHRIMHTAEPFFNRSDRTFIFKNGYKEPLIETTHFDVSDI